jgi:tRNA (guanine-N7-)-methyltransferase
MMIEQKPHLRQVRSFVRRTGRITSSQTQALTSLWQDYGLNLEHGPYDQAEVFGRVAPCTLEIGFGMGAALLEMAARSPDENFIGIEVHQPGLGTLLNGLVKNDIKNVRVFNADAKDILEHCIADGSLQRVLLFFPDPWPKARHHKRRLLQPDFVKLIAKKLGTGGIFHLATDWQHYAEHMLITLTAEPQFKNTAGEHHYALRPEDRPLTKFEQRGQKLGHGVWDLVFQKI